MIPEIDTLWHPKHIENTWQQALRQVIRDPNQLLSLLDLSHHPLAQQIVQQPRFPLRVPLGYIARMQKGNFDDPLLRQVLPLRMELQQHRAFSCDPVGDKAAEKIPNLLHKYQGRMLILATSACAIHCRYCFRQHHQYISENPLINQQIIDTMRADQTLTEIILSGGDPLMLDDESLAHFTAQLATIPQIKRLRLHTRMPIVLPERITINLIKSLTSTHLSLIIIIHANHANEFDQKVRSALYKLFEAGITLLNQSVLLHGVNDNKEALTHLSETLFQNHVIPYYLHLLDKVQGAQHFDIPEKQAIKLIDSMRKNLPGYLVPKLVREIAGLPYKQQII